MSKNWSKVLDSQYIEKSSTSFRTTFLSTSFILGNSSNHSSNIFNTQYVGRIEDSIISCNAEEILLGLKLFHLIFH